MTASNFTITTRATRPVLARAPEAVLFILTRLFGRSYRQGIAPVWA